MLCVLILFNVLTVITGQLTSDLGQMLNWCLDSDFHKVDPGPESSLYKQCIPWKKRSCCTYNITHKLHHDNHLNFNFNHCSSVRNMSNRCKEHFIQDFCFFECSPNVGPWVVKVDMKKRKERFYQVPLCKSDCNTWFESCRYDFTCVENWFLYFKWNKTSNYCPSGSDCSTFEEVFGNATNFCEKVWDHSWRVVDDSEPCMRLWFDGSDGNPNDKVAYLKASELLLRNSASTIISYGIIFLSFVLVFL